jgi:hypothetical protein
MNKYLDRLRGPAQEKHTPEQLTILTIPPAEGAQVGSVSIVSDPPIGFPGGQGADGTQPESTPNPADETVNEADSPTGSGSEDKGNRLVRVLTVLEQGCPAYVEDVRWWQACEDGRQFLGVWGDQATELGWTAKELFGLHPVPSYPHPSYARLSRYDETGLVWLLDGKVVTALTATTADIQHKTGAITVYRKLNKPALGPLGDSLEDFV